MLGPEEFAQYDALVATAQQVLGARAWQPIGLKATKRLDSEHVVLRCQVLGGSAGAPSSVIVKQMQERPGGAAGFPPRQMFLNEWASLQFLSDLRSGCAPQLLASSQAEHLIVLEDLGDGASLIDILFGDNGAEAHRRLAQFGALLGDLQASAYRQEQRFSRIQAAMQASTPVADGSIDVRTVLAPLHAMLDALAVAPPSSFDSTIAAIGAAISDESPFRAFQHFDAGAHNVISTQHTLKLLDFEFAGFGHGLIDVVGARMAFPAAYRGRRSPAESVEALEASYREHIVDTIPIAADNRLFDSAIAFASAQWTVSKLYGFWKSYLQPRLREGAAYDEQGSRSPERSAYFRRMIFTYLLAFTETAAERGLDGLRGTIGRVMEALRREWPDLEPWDLYPAFSGRDQ